MSTPQSLSSSTPQAPIDFMGFLDKLKPLNSKEGTSCSSTNSCSSSNTSASYNSSSSSMQTEIDGIGDTLGTLIGISKMLPDDSEILHTKDYPTGKEVFDEGAELLLSGVTFTTKEDAELALKSVVTRAFSMLSAVLKYITGNDYHYICSAKNNKHSHTDSSTNPHHESIGESFEAHTPSPNSTCTWEAHISKTEWGGFMVIEIGSPEMHCKDCFSGSCNHSSGLVGLASKHALMGKYEWFNAQLISKLGISVSKRCISRHNSGKKKSETKAITQKRAKTFDANNPQNSNLLPEDKELLGTLYAYEKAVPGFEFDYLIGNQTNEKDPTKLMYFGMLFPEQKKLLQRYGDLIFIDSTFCVNARGHKAINLVVVDSHLKSLLGATCFVQNECSCAYERFLRFIQKSVPQPKRLPFCFIADCAPQIHSSIVNVFPYARHIYCAFHLLKDKSLLGSANALEEESRGEFRSLARRALISHSLSVVDSSVEKLHSIYLTSSSGLDDPFKKKVESIISHSLNGSRPLQDVYTADSVASSRVESMNHLLKDSGLNPRASLIDCFEALAKFVLTQRIKEIQNSIMDENGKFLDNEEFKGIVTKEVLLGLSKEVLKLMHKEFVLSNGKYNVTQGEGSYTVVYKSNSNAYTPHTVCYTEENGTFHCSCVTRSGYPCRHVFALARHLGAKVMLSSVNSRFYLDQSNVNFHEENRRAMTTIINSIDMKNRKYGKLFTEKPVNGVQRAIRDNVDVKAYVERDLTYFGTLQNTSQGSVAVIESSIPEKAATPEIEKEEDIEICEFDLSASRNSAPEIPADIIERDGVETIVPVPVPITIPSLSSPEKKRVAVSSGEELSRKKISHTEFIAKETERVSRLNDDEIIAELTSQFYNARAHVSRESALKLHAYLMHVSFGNAVELPDYTKPHVVEQNLRTDVNTNSDECSVVGPVFDNKMWNHSEKK